MAIIHLLILLIAIVSSIATFIPITARAYELPDLGRSSASAFTPQEERKLGKEFMEELRQSVSVVEDPIVNDYIQKLGQHLAKNNANTMGKKFRFFVVQDPVINAFAGPDGYIGVNTGLILATHNESELAAVLAHEIAHVTQHHLERSFKEASSLNIPMTAALVAALLVGAGGGNNSSGNAATGALMGAMAGGIQHMISFTRSNEAEADHIGITTLYKAGFDVKAMSSFFARMQHSNLEYKGQTPPYLRTHPVTSERIADAENRSMQYHHQSKTTAINGSTLHSNNHYLLIYARLKYFTQSNNLSTLNYFKTHLHHAQEHPQKNVALNNPDAMRYGYTLALMRNQQWQEAENNINELIANDSREVIYQITKAQIQIATKHLNAAITTLKNAYTIQPNYYPLAAQYAQALIRAKQLQTAQTVLKLQLNQSDKSALSSITSPATYVTLADNAAKSGKLADAYLYRAKALKVAGYYRDAKILLQQALRLPRLSTNMQAILQAELAVTKALEQEEKN